MQTDHFRKLYRYHFAINQKIWDKALSQLSAEQFTMEQPYSVRSIRNQLVHMLETELRWFSGLQGLEAPPYSDPERYPDREQVQVLRDQVREMVELYLADLDDAKLEEPFGPPPGELKVWQGLFHVLSHGIDHRAQLLAVMNRMGVNTFPQDYALYLFGRI